MLPKCARPRAQQLASSNPWKKFPTNRAFHAAAAGTAALRQHGISGLSREGARRSKPYHARLPFHLLQATCRRDAGAPGKSYLPAPGRWAAPRSTPVEWDRDRNATGFSGRQDAALHGRRDARRHVSDLTRAASLTFHPLRSRMPAA